MLEFSAKIRWETLCKWDGEKKKICLFLYLYAVSEIHKTTFGGCEQELFLTKGPCSLAEYAISL